MNLELIKDIEETAKKHGYYISTVDGKECLIRHNDSPIPGYLYVRLNQRKDQIEDVEGK